MNRQHSNNSSPIKVQAGMKLTQEFLVMRTKQPLNHIKKLNLWGNELGDVSIIQNLTNLEVLALTVNCITTLKDFGGLTKLRELYLRRNNIVANLEELEYLQTLTSLKTLNLAENPISSPHGGLPHYRLCVLFFVPWLEKLDDILVTPDEVTQATSMNLEQIL